ncbi:MAG: hypothetical protein GY849_19005, partial [Deltaproteobacteria bacterium]|nr:hypothetical protein [Deltaproteobacteria bacterium]
MIRIRPTKPHSMDRARTTAHKPFPVSVCVQLRPAKKPSSLPRWVAASCLALAFSGGILVADAIAQPIDLGDAPDPSYPTLLASGGASHVLGGRAYLGACVDGEADGQPSAGAVGDDDGTGDPVFGTCVEGDEDGVFFTSALANGTTAGVDVLAADGCTLSAWIDWNGDGDWADPGEDLFPGGQAVASGVNSLSVAVPMTAAEGTTYARFRCTTAGVVLATGPAPDGEVEDYEVTVGPADDYGDAPAPYPTLAADSGPVHALGGPYLGTCVDTEADGQPSDVNPGGDDVNVGDPAVGSCVLGDDEDGVVFTAVLTPGTSPGVDVRASAACTLSGWIDWNGDGDWADTGETVFPGTALNAGVNSLSVVVPAAATTGPTWGRFRCTTDGAVAVTGAAADGEVEDYPLTVGPTSDYGDAPDPSYPTLGGASHVLGGVVWLGACVDGEADGQPSAVADGDDHAAGNPVFGSCAGGDDEDGVVFTSVLVPGESATVDVTASASCTLSAWIDWNGDGDWADVDEELFVESWPVLVAGVNNLGFDVPLTATSGLTHARFRCASSGPLSVDGAAADGEVEDHLVAISDLDFGDAPDPSYPTLLASDGARHAVGFGSNVWLGNCVDAETDGQPTAAANGDDDDAGTPFGACVAGDDEDGVTFTSTFFEGGGAGSVDVVAASACTLSAWVDWTGDGDWLDPGEDLFPGGQAIEMGLTSLGFAVPATAVAGTTTARFRCTTG